MLYDGKTIIPFVNNYPKNTLSYAVMTSNINDAGMKENLMEKIRAAQNV